MNVTELIERLRENKPLIHGEDLDAAADALEAQAREIADLSANLERLQQRWATRPVTDDLQARLAEAERDIAQWKKVYDLRGRALQRPCINCGHVPLVIHADAARATDSAGEKP